MSVLLIGNTGLLEVTGVSDGLSGAYFNEADVTAVIKKQSGVVVGTVTLEYVAASNGTYRGTIDDTAGLVNGKFYIVEVTAESDGLIARWREDDVLARYRNFDE